MKVGALNALSKAPHGLFLLGAGDGAHGRAHHRLGKQRYRDLEHTKSGTDRKADHDDDTAANQDGGNEGGAVFGQ